MPNPARRELNERLDEQKDRYVQQAEVALREQEEKLSAGAGLLPPQPTDDDYEELGAALEGEAAPGSLPEEEPGRPHDSHAARRPSRTRQHLHAPVAHQAPHAQRAHPAARMAKARSAAPSCCGASTCARCPRPSRRTSRAAGQQAATSSESAGGVASSSAPT